jgi:hypothetical protein
MRYAVMAETVAIWQWQNYGIAIRNVAREKTKGAKSICLPRPCFCWLEPISPAQLSPGQSPQ